MFKTKTKLKLLIALVIMLLAVCVLNINTVNATTQEELQAMLDVIPSEIKLDITELEAGTDNKKVQDEIEENIKSIWKENNMSMEGVSISSYGGNFKTDGGFYKGNIVLNGKQKQFSLVYSNSNQRNSADEQAVKNIIKESPKYYEISLEIASKDGMNQINSFTNVLKNYYSKFETDSSIKFVYHGGGAGDGLYLNYYIDGYVAVYKNGIYYDNANIDKNMCAYITSINIPSTVTDNELNDYIINAIKKYNQEYASKITKIEEGINGNENDICEGYFTELISNTSNIYTITSTTTSGSMSEYIIVKRTSNHILNDTKTNIKLETANGVIPSNTVLEVEPITEGTTYNTVKTTLTNISKFKVYDINLLSDGVKIQPNGKVKISVPVPTEYNKSNIVVYRVADNGDKTEYAVAINGDVATFETDHFSTYVLAEKEVKQNTGNTDNTETTPTKPVTEDRKKDDTPKTGTIASIYFIIPVTVISAIGIIAFRRKETK